MHDFDLNLDEISKIEGAASLDLKVRDNKIIDLKFSISEWKRFYTQAIKGKPAIAIPPLVSRICGTCSNAHLLASIEGIEKAHNIIPSPQTILLRKLLYYGLIIRDHALHLYVFTLPDLLNKQSILDFDTNVPLEHEMLDDTFTVKEVGNQLSIIAGGRSVHAPNLTIGGFIKLPKIEELKNLIPQLVEIRPKIIKLIQIYAEKDFTFKLKTPLTYAALYSEDFSFLEGVIRTCSSTQDVIAGQCQSIPENELGKHLEASIIPYSHARGFTFSGNLMMVGALARLNISKETLNQKTKSSVKQYLDLFPSNNLFHNNLAQAIEILHAIDTSIEIITNLSDITAEAPIKIQPAASNGVGVIEAPRGTLYYQFEINADGTLKKGDIIVPTGQNQIVMEKSIYELVEKLLDEGKDKDMIVTEIEKLIRAFDPCMSCAAHFLKVRWK